MDQFSKAEAAADETSEIRRQLEQRLTRFEEAVAAIPLAALHPMANPVAGMAATETALDALAADIATLRVQCESATRAIEALEVNLSHTLPMMEFESARKRVEQLTALHQARSLAEATLHEYEELLTECRRAVGAQATHDAAEDSGAG